MNLLILIALNNLLLQNLLEKINCEKQDPGQLKYIIYSRVGDGPTFCDDPNQHLLNKQGLPVDL